jgi:hypothetical protein
VIVKSRQISAKRVAAVEGEVGEVQAELGNGAEAPGVPYVNVWIGVSSALDISQGVYDMLGSTVAALNQVTSRANKASVEVGGV